MYIVGQEETVGESSVSVVAGVRTVTTNMDGRDALPRLSRPFAFYKTPILRASSQPIKFELADPSFAASPLDVRKVYSVRPIIFWGYCPRHSLTLRARLNYHSLHASSR